MKLLSLFTVYFFDAFLEFLEMSDALIMALLSCILLHINMINYRILLMCSLREHVKDLE